MEFTQRLRNTAISLMGGKPTSRELMVNIPANNPPDYFKMLRHDFGITILKEKVTGKRHFVFWIPECEFPKVRKLIARATNTSNLKSDSKAITTNLECTLPQTGDNGGGS